MTLTTISKEEFTSFANTVSIALLSSLLKWQICLKSEEIPFNLSLGNKNDQVQVAANLYSLPMTGGLHMEINSGPLYQEEAMLEPFYAALKDYAKKMGY